MKRQTLLFTVLTLTAVVCMHYIYKVRLAPKPLRVRMEPHSLAENLGRMNRLVSTLNLASRYSGKQLYDLIDTNAQIMPILDYDPEMEGIFNTINDTEKPKGESNQFIDVWGHSFFIETDGHVTRTNPEGSVVRGVVFFIFSAGANGPLGTKADTNLSVGPFVLWQDGKPSH